MLVPVVVRDARFRAGRALVTTGHASEATGTFVSLLDGCRASYKDDDIECAAAYYEYGNALFRSLGEEESADPEENEHVGKPKENEETHDLKRKAAEAAEKRFASIQPQTKPDSTTQKEEEIKSETDKQTGKDDTGNTMSAVESMEKAEDNGDDEEGEAEDNEQSDMELALENMETAWSILDQHLSSSSSPRYFEWGTEQFPRYLTGIGDVLAAMGRHADAADAYSRAVKHRQAHLQTIIYDDDKKSDSKPARSHGSNKKPHLLLDQLICRRRIVETFVLMAEQFLACPAGEDVVTTETKSLLCKANERVDYARGYYDKAKDELQETVFLMGQIVAANPDLDIAEEKENICFASTLLMGVGMELAKVDEEEKAAAASSGAKEPAKKKSKVG